MIAVKIFVLLAALAAVAGASSSNRINRDTWQKMRTHSCRPILQLWSAWHITAPYSDRHYLCNGLQTDFLVVRHCKPYCFDPTDCQSDGKMSNVTNRAVFANQVHFERRSGVPVLLRIPIACECVGEAS